MHAMPPPYDFPAYDGGMENQLKLWRGDSVLATKAGGLNPESSWPITLEDGNNLLSLATVWVDLTLVERALVEIREELLNELIKAYFFSCHYYFRH